MRAEEFAKSYLAKYKPFKAYWNYEDSCVLMGAKQLYEATHDEFYAKFLVDFVSKFIDEDGTINNFQVGKNSIDNISCSKILFFLYDYTGEERYKKAIEFTMEELRKHPRCDCGNFFHKAIYPYQIWLDGLYMAQPFYMEYETRFDNKEKYQDIISQFENAQKFLYDEKKGLCYHAFDEKKVQFWADPQTGRSANFWLRSMGWYLLALIDTMDNMSKEIYEGYRSLQDIFQTAIHGILQYQDPESKLFYQVIDRSDVEGNYLESSGSAMVAYAILKGCRLGALLPEKYLPIGKEIFENLEAKRLEMIDGELHLSWNCSVAGLGPDTNRRRDGSVAYYLSEPITNDDTKGVGAFFMAYAEYLKATK